MPSPLAHLATGLAIHLSTRPNLLSKKEEVKQIGLISLATLLPDLDVIPGVITSRIATYHNRESHSFLFTLGATTILAMSNRASARLAMTLVVASVSHLLLDGLGSRRGLMLFWPFTQRRYSGGLKLFRGVRWQLPANSLEHRQTLLTEIPYAIAALILGIILGKLRRQ